MKRKKIEFNFIEYLEHNKKRIIINLIIFSSILFALLLIDLLTKQFLFEWKNDGSWQGLHQGNVGFRYENKLFGIRSISNSGLTVIGNSFPHGLVHFFNFIILFVSLFFLCVVHSHWFAVGIAFVFAGTLGNMIDRFAFNFHVRDIIYLPWCDRGTFNFADVDAIVGAFMISITLIVLTFKSYYKERR